MWGLLLTAFADILHNIADHTATLLKLSDEQSLAPDIVARLNQHMLLEEQENTTKLQEMQALEPSPITQKLLDHSFLIQRMMQGEAMSLELRRDLLDHFMEEHKEWMAEISANSNARQWTVGPLWPQGG